MCLSVIWLRFVQLCDPGGGMLGRSSHGTKAWGNSQSVQEWGDSPLDYGITLWFVETAVQLGNFCFSSQHHLWFVVLPRVQEKAHTPAMQDNWLYLEGLASALWSSFITLMRGGLDHSLVTISELFRADYSQWLTESVFPFAKLLMIGYHSSNLSLGWRIFSYLWFYSFSNLWPCYA